jgi:hypothetical protein
MVKRFLAPLAVVGLGLCLVGAEQARPSPAKADLAAVAKLVTQLGSECYEDREAASKALDALGPAALGALRMALTGRDEETRHRAIDLLRRIELRLETARLTQPKLVHLVYKDTPVAEAVQDMVRKTGFQIQIEGDQTKLADRKITLDTGEIPFWQAVDQFCQKAGLVERGSLEIPEDTNPNVDGRSDVDKLVCMVMRIEMQEGNGDPRPEAPLVFLDGKAQAMPTYYGGAVRVRVLPRTAPNAGAPQNGCPVNKLQGETLLTVEISPEPKLGLQKLLSLRVEKVIDEQGNELKAPLPYIGDFADHGNVELLLGSSGGRLPDNNLSKQVPIRLLAPEGAKRLKEIRGFVAAEVLTPREPFITVEDILNAADKTVKADAGGSLKVSEVRRDDKGQVTLRVVIDQFPMSQTHARGFQMLMLRGGQLAPALQPSVESMVEKILSLVDEKGQAFKLVTAEEKLLHEAPGATVEYRLTFQPPSGAPKPAKLTYLGKRHATIDVPFVLKDVPLP